MTTEAQKYDAIIIGTGQGGKPLASALADAGWKTAIVERRYVGGTCVNDGCSPTKTMVASSRVAHLARRGADYGVKCGDVEVDIATVIKRKREIVESFRGGSRKGLEEAENIDLIFGEAGFTGPQTLQIKLNDGGQRTITSEKIFINVGCKPSVPPIPGIDSVPTLDSTSIMEVDNLPRRLLVMGGGVIGLEFGQMFARFGSEVAIVQMEDQLLPREDADVADELKKILEEDGIEVYVGTKATKVEPDANGGVKLTVSSGDGEKVLTGSDLLVAVGRVPNTPELNLDSAGVETNKRGFIPVNQRLETNVPGIWALGDVNGGPQFTHISYDDFRILKANLLDDGKLTTTDRMVPSTVFTDPQLGRIGISEKEAKEKDLKVRVAKIPMSWVARALEVDETRGLMKAIVDAETSQILGCAILGIEGGEVMTMLQIAMMGQVPFEKLREGIFSHPGLAEAFNTLFGSFEE